MNPLELNMSKAFFEQDYYPFGMLEPGRNYNLRDDTAFRYGFNKGSERDDDVEGKGNEYATTLREFDSRLNIWWSADSKPNAFESVYMAMSDNPLWHNDPIGDVVDGGPSGPQGGWSGCSNGDDVAPQAKNDNKNKPASAAKTPGKSPSTASANTKSTDTQPIQASNTPEPKSGDAPQTGITFTQRTETDVPMLPGEYLYNSFSTGNGPEEHTTTNGGPDVVSINAKANPFSVSFTASEMKVGGSVNLSHGYSASLSFAPSGINAEFSYSHGNGFGNTSGGVGINISTVQVVTSVAVVAVEAPYSIPAMAAWLQQNAPALGTSAH